MYRSCIFCSADLGSNEAVERFPVGAQLAFDAWKGRLWAVCPSCARWNLSPIEERWEAVEEAEKLFRDARLRVQSENVGLAKLPDGTRLVRVGEAVPGELAAWRYGTQLLKRRRRYFIVGGLSVAAGVAAVGGATAMGMGLGSLWVANNILRSRRRLRVVHRIDRGYFDPGVTDDAGRPYTMPKRSDLVIRRWHLPGLSLDAGADGQVQVLVRDANLRKPRSRGQVQPRSKDIVVVQGDAARALLGRAMVHVNAKGATKPALNQANSLLGEAGSADRILREAAAGGAALGDRAGPSPAVLTGAWALAFEMALNEADERRALEGELANLRAAWREAEEIAAIADALPGEAALNRLIDRFT